MLIADSLSFPRNFAFFQRLPARFEILVLARGEKTGRGTFFDLQVAGQKLTMLSRVELTPGQRYEIERNGSLEFRIVAEKVAADENPAAEQLRQVESLKDQEVAPYFPLPQLPARLLLKVTEGKGNAPYATGNKVVFDFDAELAVRGAFVTDSNGQISLFLTGRSDLRSALGDLQSALGMINLKQISVVTSESFAALSAGGINLTS